MLNISLANTKSFNFQSQPFKASKHGNCNICTSTLEIVCIRRNNPQSIVYTEQTPPKRITPVEHQTVIHLEQAQH